MLIVLPSIWCKENGILHLWSSSPYTVRSMGILSSWEIWTAPSQGRSAPIVTTLAQELSFGLWLLESSGCCAQVLQKGLLITPSYDFKGSSVFYKVFWQRASQWLNCVAWERGSVSPTSSSLVTPLSPPAELHGVTHPSGLLNTGERHRAGILALPCSIRVQGSQTYGLFKAGWGWEFSPTLLWPAATSCMKRLDCPVGLIFDTLLLVWWCGGCQGAMQMCVWGTVSPRKASVLKPEWRVQGSATALQGSRSGKFSQHCPGKEKKSLPSFS